MTRWVRERGQACGRRRIARLMRGAGLSARPRRRFRVSLTDSDHDLPIAPNRLRERAVPVRPNPVWVADITYVETAEGWLYVAGVLDRCSRRCVGWAMGDSLATTLPLAALEMALTHRRPPAGLVPSLSRRGNGYDNAVRESFWSRLKRELVHRRQFQTRAEAQAALFEWLEVFYNRERFHRALDYQSPVDFELNLN